MNKVPDYKINKLSKDLDKIVSHISSRGIFVISKNSHGLYDLVNYLNKEITITDIPTREYANKICDRMNTSSKYNWNRQKDIQSLNNQYAKWYTDCFYHIHTILHAKSELTYLVAETRKEQAEINMKHILAQLKTII